MRKQLVGWFRLGLFAASAMASHLAMAEAGNAEAGGTGAGAQSPTGIAEIIVTAQKREQNLQDVPVAISALGEEDIKNNRVVSLMDLGAVVPGVSVRNTPGGISAPQIVIRGALSSGGLPGSDKAVSLNIDGVYVGANYAISSDMLDLERVEALRGPQGTLFGRNSTGGAINFFTKDPTGEFGVHQELMRGNFDQFRSLTHLELPAFGPFSGYVSYMRNQRDGDVRNLQSGVVFDRSLSPQFGKQVSADTLGDNKSDAYRVAVKFQPTDHFAMSYKFDKTIAAMTAPATGLVYYDPAIAAFFGLGGINPAVAAANVPVAGTHRPNAVANAYTTLGHSGVYGHVLTATFTVNDQLSLKDILAYRRTSIAATADTTGLGQLFYPGNPNPFYVNVAQQENKQKQWSDELQLNYNSHFLTLTVGGLYYWEKVRTGAFSGLEDPQYLLGVPLPGNVVPAGNDDTDITSKSRAGYGQAEVHVMPQLDLVGGLRVTRDQKDGTAFFTFLPVAPFTYSKSKTTFNVGINYRPIDSVLAYTKYSTGFISGGSVAGYTFDPEEAKSWELGVKSELFDRRLRLNVAGFLVDYDGVQQPVPGYLIGAAPSLVMVNLGDSRAKGFEADVTVAPVTGLTLNGSVSYTNYKWKRLIAAFAGATGVTADTFPVWLRPSTTVNLSANYETPSLFNNAHLTFHLDTDHRSAIVTPGLFARPPAGSGFASVYETGGEWISNARIALQNIQHGRANVEIAIWARNLFNDKGSDWGGYNGFVAGTTYVPARTYGADLTFDF
ncbi:MAG TPA: TonB-dependent receptor [Steroidobacteraceae bacterium]|nr:TonB-dependent receptor [Steroidobacteraceae bacterium]